MLLGELADISTRLESAIEGIADWTSTTAAEAFQILGLGGWESTSLPHSPATTAPALPERKIRPMTSRSCRT